MTQNQSPQNIKRPIIYIKVPNCEGICTIWDWSESKQKYIKRPEGLMYLAYKKIMNKQRSKCFYSLKSAQKWRENLTSFDEAPSKSTFKEVMQKFFQHKASKLSVTTVETYESNTKHFTMFLSTPVSLITPKAIDSWLTYIKRPEYVATQNKTRLTYHHELSVLRQILVFYSEYLDDSFQVPIKKRHYDDCIIDHLKYKMAKAKNKQKYIPRSDYYSFVEHLFRQSEQKPHKLLFAVMAWVQVSTGLRVGEIAALDFKDIDRVNKRITVSKSVQWCRKKGRETTISQLTKTAEIRVISTTEQVLEALSDWQKQIKRTKGLIFSQDGFSPVSYRAIQYSYNNAFKALGMNWTSTHILRHSFATDFLEKTLNQLALQQTLGHKSLRQTEHYAKITQKLTEQSMSAYNQSYGGTVIPFKIMPNDAIEPEKSSAKLCEAVCNEETKIVKIKIAE